MKKDNNTNTTKHEITVTSNTVFLWFITIGMLLIAAGTVMPLLMQDASSDLFKYVYGGGAAMLIIGRLFTSYKGDNVRLKRLYRIETWSAIFFCVAVFFMFYEGAGARDWLAFTLAGGAIQIYTSIMIPRTIAKSK
jgi:preprotein translocase subunit SecG